jgi:hypothetical protein
MKPAKAKAKAKSKNTVSNSKAKVVAKKAPVSKVGKVSKVAKATKVAVKPGVLKISIPKGTAPEDVRKARLKRNNSLSKALGSKLALAVAVPMTPVPTPSPVDTQVSQPTQAQPQFKNPPIVLGAGAGTSAGNIVTGTSTDIKIASDPVTP